MKTSKTAEYITFGQLLCELRQKAGLAQQSDLAALLKTTQQTVSRWELGLSRPRDKQIPLIVKVLNAKVDNLAKVDDLLAAAGYTATTKVATFDQPFPIDALNPDSFERFCYYFLSELYRERALVNRVGAQGHTQHGLDIEAIFPDGVVHTFQCKRVGSFGPKKVHTAVISHTRPATKKFLLLSRVASPREREEIRKHADWEIWDREHVSRVIRQDLIPEKQLRLVDTFFHGQRLALLGETEAGPWQTTEQFFAPFMSKQGAFNHKWELVGRDQQITQLNVGLANPDFRAIFLVGAGGCGKSRLLKQVIETYEQENHSVLVRFLSPSEEVTNKSLEQLGKGLKILVVDDAHDRTDLQLLFQYASIQDTNTKLVLSFRPYGIDFINAQASRFALVGPCRSETKLEPLTLEQATHLATQVLTEFSGPPDAAKDIANLTRDCPLATVMGAQVVAKEKIHFELAKYKDLFRSTLLGKFQDIVAGNLGTKSDSGSIKQVLKVLALLQPFYPDDESVASVVEKVEGIKSPEVNKIIRLLTDAGVLFKRGGKYRLSPDLLADFIIESTCIRENGRSTGYAEQVFDAAIGAHIENILVNLGKLDWRRASGNPSDSPLLDGVWQRLRPSNQYSDPHINAVKSVAYYQPTRTLDFADALIRSGKYLDQVPDLIKNVAYNLEHLPKACEFLWELGKSDSRELHRHPGHAIRILAELCAIEPHKPIEYNKAVVDFGLSLLNSDSSWAYAYTPFDILEGIIQTEGHTTTSNGRSFSMGGFLVKLSTVSALRTKVIDAVINLLTHANTRIAVQAARFLQGTLRYPIGILNIAVPTDVRDAWTGEFVMTLRKIKNVIQGLDPLVLLEIAKAVSWHANYAKEETMRLAKEIVASMPSSLEFRTVRALVDGYGHLLERLDYKRSEKKWERFLDTLTQDLVSKYPDGEELRAFLESAMNNITKNSARENASPHQLYWRLVQASGSLAQATVQHALRLSGSATDQFAGTALSKLLRDDHSHAIQIAKKFLDSASTDLHAAIGRAYAGVEMKNEGYEDDDLVILRRILSSNDHWVVRGAVQATRSVAKENKTLALELVKHVNIGASAKVADEVLILFQKEEVIPFRLLSEEDVQHFLNQLKQLPELEGYWIETFLAKASKNHAQRTVKFFMDRVDHAVTTKDWKYRPCNSGPYIHVRLRFRESEEFGGILRHVSQWMKSRTEKGYYFQSRAAELFDAMFSPFDTEMLGFIQDWVDTGTEGELQLIAGILGEAPQRFVFEQRAFVMRFLEKAKQHHGDVLDSAVGNLIRSAISGIRTGTPGEPFPQDSLMRSESEEALKEIPRFSPAYGLYESLKKHAEAGIARALKDGEALDEG